MPAYNSLLDLVGESINKLIKIACMQTYKGSFQVRYYIDMYVLRLSNDFQS